jgi:tetratricopeptide (TPR) repeat protein
LGVYYILRGLLLEEVHVDKFSFSVYYKNIRILPETISKYFIPISVKALSRFELSTTITGLVIFILLLILPLILTSISKKRYYFGIFIFVFLLIPGMVFRTMGQDGFYYWDCRSYLPSLGLVFVSAEVVQSLSKYTYKKYFTAFFIIYLITLSYFTFSKIKVYENAVTYWESVKADYPSNFLPYVGLFNYYKESNKPDQAELELLKAIEINPKDESLWMILNNFYLTNRKNEEAFFFLKKKIEIEKTLPDNLLESYISVCVQLKRFEDIDYILYNISNYNLKKNKILKTIDYNIKILNQNNLDASALNRMINKYRE